ncbi:MAG: hypothetical protein C5B51_13285 [Terriglobia bacterium]|nr:MAG: hypothetical protein C5B51_13285 [Terriglobia bacterium]
MLEGEAESILRKVIDLALKGNEKAQRLCLERLMPPCRERTIQFTRLLKTTTAANVAQSVDDIMAGVAEGDITPGEAVQLASVLEVRRKVIETEDFERRLSDLENGANSPNRSG